jgi:hypothetical protein
MARTHGAAAHRMGHTTRWQWCDCTIHSHGSHSCCCAASCVSVLWVCMAVTVRAPPHPAAHGRHRFALPYHCHHHCCAAADTVMVCADDVPMQHRATAARVSHQECAPLRRLSALPLCHPRRVPLCACGSERSDSAPHSHCSAHSPTDSSRPHSHVGSAASQRHSACRPMHRARTPTSLLSLISASHRRLPRARSVMYSSPQQIVFTHTEWQSQCSTLSFMRER